MTGTAKTDAEEFRDTYNVNVVQIPTNKPIRREDHSDEVYVTNKAKVLASLNIVKNALTQGRPVLVETGSVSMSNLYSLLLLQQKVPHNLLNATTVAKESLIVSEAGRKGAVTVATSMAGRGTDIKLGDGVKELGGLAVIGIGRMNNSRSERQARGRAGRQGDPGFSQYYVSLEDDIVGAEDDDKLQRYIDGKKRIGKRKIKRIVNQCQKLSVESEEMNRKKSLQYDQVLQRQRDLIYATRKKLARRRQRRGGEDSRDCEGEYLRLR